MRKPFRLLGGELKTPPMGTDARMLAGDALRAIQEGETLTMPLSRPMPTIGPHVHELRVEDGEMDCIWRIFYRIDRDAVVVAEVLKKKTKATPKKTIGLCKQRFRRYDNMMAAEAAAKKGRSK